MTFRDLLDMAVLDAGDPSPDFRTNARRWLNLVRAFVSQQATWSAALTASTFAYSQNANGVFTLTGFDRVLGQELYDMTGNYPVKPALPEDIWQFDPNHNDFGPPAMWSAAGRDTDGSAKIQLYPIPSLTGTMGFFGAKLIADLTDADDDSSVDAYFGCPVNSMAQVFKAGLRYHYEIFNDEAEAQGPNVQAAEQRFMNQIRLRHARENPAGQQASRLQIVNRRTIPVPQGRLNPAHFDNF